jgi:uncharacterized protein YnzC (UPF0291/DUF896 family)
MNKHLLNAIKYFYNNNKFKHVSILIDLHLKPQKNDKLQNAEKSTPYKLRKEMLDKIPKDFWTKKNKVFKPCAGN